MSSGKSSELARLLRRKRIANRAPVYAFKPATDTRDGESIRSRDGITYDAVVVDTPEELLDRVEAIGVIGLDEAQFFPPGIVPVVETLVRLGHEVICAGLDTDSFGKPFGAMPHLLAIADTVTKLTAVCKRCGAEATRSQLLVDAPEEIAYGAPMIKVGGEEAYEARCRTCHVVPVPAQSEQS